jgi:hypothetical protein
LRSGQRESTLKISTVYPKDIPPACICIACIANKFGEVAVEVLASTACVTAAGVGDAAAATIAGVVGAVVRAAAADVETAVLVAVAALVAASIPIPIPFKALLNTVPNAFQPLASSAPSKRNRAPRGPIPFVAARAGNPCIAVHILVRIPAAAGFVKDMRATTAIAATAVISAQKADLLKKPSGSETKDIFVISAIFSNGKIRALIIKVSLNE